MTRRLPSTDRGRKTTPHRAVPEPDVFSDGLDAFKSRVNPGQKPSHSAADAGGVAGQIVVETDHHAGFARVTSPVANCRNVCGVVPKVYAINALRASSLRSRETEQRFGASATPIGRQLVSAYEGDDDWYAPIVLGWSTTIKTAPCVASWSNTIRNRGFRRRQCFVGPMPSDRPCTQDDVLISRPASMLARSEPVADPTSIPDTRTTKKSAHDQRCEPECGRR